jgi:hypothetical protein
MLSGMRKKTSLTLDEASMPLARSRAAAEGLDVGRWLDRAIRNEATQGDVEVIESWESRLPDSDRATLEALERLDHLDAGDIR